MPLWTGFCKFEERMKLKYLVYMVSVIALAAILNSCTNAKANSVRQDLETWVNNLLTPSKTTLEKAETGYQIKAKLKDKPKNLVMLWEMRDDLFFMDSTRTDAEGNFTFKGNIKEPVFCMVQWGDNNSIYLFIDNKTNATIEINPDGSYSIQGKGIEGSTGLKELIDLNTNFNVQFTNLQNQINNLPNSAEGYQKALLLQATYRNLIAKRNNDIVAYALNKKKSLIPYFIVRFKMVESPSLELLEHALRECKSYSPTSKYTADMQKRYDTESRLAVGAVAPEIKLPQPSGDTLALSSLRGKIVLIDFWASWCGPCRRENPYNTKLYKKWHSQGFEIIGVSLDEDKGRWKGAIATDSLVWRHVSDLKGWGSAPAKIYNVTGIPNTFLLDQNGRILAKGLRGEELGNKLEEIFAKNK